MVLFLNAMLLLNVRPLSVPLLFGLPFLLFDQIEHHSCGSPSSRTNDLLSSISRPRVVTSLISMATDSSVNWNLSRYSSLSAKYNCSSFFHHARKHVLYLPNCLGRAAVTAFCPVCFAVHFLLQSEQVEC